MSEDGFDQLMGLEDAFYTEGYEAGLADGKHAGIIEGQLFGIEKGYEKALEMGRLRGRAMVWKERASRSAIPTSASQTGSMSEQKLEIDNIPSFDEIVAALRPFQDSTRLKKHIDALLRVVSNENMDMSNSDKAVADFDNAIIKARNKAKVISNIAGEVLSPTNNGSNAVGIEDAKGLLARE